MSTTPPSGWTIERRVTDLVLTPGRRILSVPEAMRLVGALLDAIEEEPPRPPRREAPKARRYPLQPVRQNT